MAQERGQKKQEKKSKKKKQEKKARKKRGVMGDNRTYKNAVRVVYASDGMRATFALWAACKPPHDKWSRWYK